MASKPSNASLLRKHAETLAAAKASLQAGLAAATALPTTDVIKALAPSTQAEQRPKKKKTRFAATQVRYPQADAKTTKKDAKKRKAEQAAALRIAPNPTDGSSTSAAASSNPLSKRYRLQSRSKEELFSKTDDGFEMYKKRGKQFALMQLETVDRIKAYLKPVLLPEKTGWLISIIGPIKFSKQLVTYAVNKAWDKYDERVVEGRPRENVYRELQADGSPAFMFDKEIGAASDAYRVITMELLSFLKSCVKSPSSFYAFIHIVKTRRAAFPQVMIDSLGEPYRKVFDLAWKRMAAHRDDDNIFMTMSDYEMKQVVAESLCKERQTRHVGGFYDEEEAEEERTQEEVVKED